VNGNWHSGAQPTRRTASFDELVPAAAKAEEVQVVIQELADARLITTDEKEDKKTVTLAHERLIDAWPWLEKLVNENRDVIALQHEIVNDANEWDENDRDASYLYRGARLASVREQLEAKRFVLSGLAVEFVRQSHARNRRGQIALITAVSTIIALLVLAVIVFGNLSGANARQANVNATQASDNGQLANQNAAIAGTAQAASQLSRSREFAALVPSLLDEHVDISLLLSVESFNYVNTGAARKSLLSSLLASPHLYASGYLTALEFSPDGSLLASGDQYGTVLLWDVSNRTQPRQLAPPLTDTVYAVTSIAFRPDNKILAAGDGDGSILLWDISDPSHPRITISARPTAEPFPERPPSILGQIGVVANLDFSPDGKTLISSTPNEIVLWNVADPTNPSKLSSPTAGQPGVDINDLALSPNGQMMAYTTCAEATNSAPCPQSKLVLWDVSNPSQPIQLGSQMVGQLGRESRFTFSPDSKTITFTQCSEVNESSECLDHEIGVWEYTHSNEARHLGANLEGSAGIFQNLAFDPNDNAVLSIQCGAMDFATGNCTEAELVEWDTTDASQPLKLRLPLPSPIARLSSISPDAKTVAYADNDIITLWEIGLPLEVSSPSIKVATDALDQVSALEFSPSGKILASSTYDKTIVWDFSDPSKLNPSGKSLTGSNPVFSPDGKTIATTDDCSGVDSLGGCISKTFLWDITKFAEPVSLAAPLRGSAYDFGPNGKTLFSLGSDGDIFWDITDPTHPIMLGMPIARNIYCAPTLIPDSKTMALLDTADDLRLWDVSNPGKPVLLGELPANDNGCPQAFSPNGRLLAARNSSGIFLWDVSNPSAPKPFGQLSGHRSFVGIEGTVSDFVFSPDNRTLLSAGWDGLIILWNISGSNAPAQFGTPLKISTSTEGMLLAISADGRTLASAAGSSISLWDISDPSAPVLLGELPGRSTDSFGSGISSFAFSPDDKILVSGSRDGSILLWDVDPQSWVTRACQKAGRNFTRDEWTQYFPDEEYHATCPQWMLEPEASPAPSPTP